MNLIKPHGSLSWEDLGGEAKDVRWNEPLSGAPLLKPMRPGTGSYPQPFILGAVPIKDELIRGTQNDNPKIYQTIADQWAAVVQAVTRADELTVVGYGFPPEDGYGRWLFRQAAKRRDRRPLKLSYYALSCDAEKVEAALRDIFGECVTYTYEGRVKEPKESSRCSGAGA